MPRNTQPGWFEIVVGTHDLRSGNVADLIEFLAGGGDLRLGYRSAGVTRPAIEQGNV
jgi:hypothetical protein